MTSANKKWIGAGLLTAGVATACASHAITELLVRLAINRKCPAFGALAQAAIKASDCPLEFLKAVEKSAEELGKSPTNRYRFLLRTAPCWLDIGFAPLIRSGLL